jgi:hypothetical protein
VKYRSCGSVASVGPSGCELGRLLVGLLELLPARHCPADRRARVVARQAGELVGVRVADDHVPHLTPVEAVAQVVGSEQRRCRRQYRAELDRRQHRVPQRYFVAEHHQDAIATLDALAAQPVGDLVRALRHLRIGHLLFRAVLVHHPQRRPVVALRHHVEVIQRPVELGQLRRLVIAIRGLVVRAVRLKEIACLDESRIRHVCSFLLDETTGQPIRADSRSRLKTNRRPSPLNRRSRPGTAWLVGHTLGCNVPMAVSCPSIPAQYCRP